MTKARAPAQVRADRERVAETVSAALVALERRKLAEAWGAKDPVWLDEAVKSVRWAELIRAVETLGLARCIRILEDSMKASKGRKAAGRKKPA